MKDVITTGEKTLEKKGPKAKHFSFETTKRETRRVKLEVVVEEN